MGHHNDDLEQRLPTLMIRWRKIDGHNSEWNEKLIRYKSVKSSRIVAKNKPDEDLKSEKNRYESILQIYSDQKFGLRNTSVSHYWEFKFCERIKNPIVGKI